MNRDQSPKRVRAMNPNPHFCSTCTQLTLENLEVFVDQAIDASLPPVPAVIAWCSEPHLAIAERAGFKVVTDIYRKRAIFVELLRMYLTPSSYKNPYKYSFEVGPKENWPLDFMNGGIQLKNASFKKMNFLPLRELLRRVSWATSLCDTDWQQQQHLTGWALLHPRRRHLWFPSEFSVLCLGSENDLECGHCRQLCSQFCIDAEFCRVEENFDPDDLLGDLEFDDDCKILNYAQQVILVEPLLDQVDSFGDDPGYYPQIAVSSTNDINKGTVCWRFLKTTCERCGYQVALGPPGNHCLACYYFMHVLNELVASLTRRDCPTDCLHHPFNKMVAQWPHRII